MRKSLRIAAEKGASVKKGDRNEGLLDFIAIYEPALDEFVTRHFEARAR